MRRKPVQGFIEVTAVDIGGSIPLVSRWEESIEHTLDFSHPKVKEPRVLIYQLLLVHGLKVILGVFNPPSLWTSPMCG